MRIRTLCAVTLTGPVIPPRTDVNVPAGFEQRAQRLIDNGSAERIDEASPHNPERDVAPQPSAPVVAPRAKAKPKRKPAAKTG